VVLDGENSALAIVKPSLYTTLKQYRPPHIYFPSIYLNIIITSSYRPSK